MSTYLQTTLSECGMACVGHVAAHHKNAFSMNELRTRFALSIRGTSLRDLIRMGEVLGLGARAVRMDLQGLTRLTLPCILHWDLTHFVVLTKVSRRKITIHDPAKGLRTLPLKEASEHFTGFALEMWPTPAFQQIKPKPPISWRDLMGPIIGLRRSLLQLLLLAAALQVVALILPLFTQWLMDGPVVSGELDLIGVIAIGFVLLTVVRTVLEWTRGWLGIVATYQLGIQWSSRIARHLFKLPMHWYEVRHTGDVLSRFQSANNIQQTVTGKLVDIVLDALFAIITGVVMLIYSPLLAAVAVFTIVAYAAIRLSTHGAFHRLSDEALVHEATAQSHFLESLRAMQSVKIAGLEAHRASDWANRMVQASNRRMLSNRMTLTFGSSYSLLFGLETVAVLAAGAYMTIEGALTVGMLMAFIAYKNEFSSRMQRFIDNMMSMRMLRLHVERLSDIVLTEPEKTAGTLPEQFDSSGWAPPEIHLDKVSFRYAEGGPWVLKDIDLKLHAGEHVAIVGPTGCGKTTLAKIILGLLEPTSGTVRVDGQPLSYLGLSNWRRRIGVVMQDDQLFSASLKENIAGLDGVIDMGRVQAAARAAFIHDDILAMPMGYDTLNGDMGNTLSGGQKQRLLLARALYREPCVLVLDEATSHLDVEREQQVNESIGRLPVTRITIAHRPDTIAMAERVIDITRLHASAIAVEAAAP
ncbi:peptidase domain-containing ABC transporter [Delftia acidovorans]|uniref:Peptidase domain-containing ABC transporter n=1 Tax=Delftia acidovorans TaxID=80866 RepID=A0AAJ2QX14_DELAC|nr:peptidase domain-containing ABC transporter [Delftia acidovorans]MDX4953541.1 peptidase domain-containing ABC transporter [Delftia acidovorans]